MLTLTKIKTDHPDYSFVEELLHLSFPEAERRGDDAQREQTEPEQRFKCHLTHEETGKGNCPGRAYYDLESEWIYLRGTSGNFA